MKDAWAWAMVVMLLTGSIGPSLKELQWLVARPYLYDFQFLIFRQAALATVCIALLLLADLALPLIKPARRIAPAEETSDVYMS